MCLTFFYLPLKSEKKQEKFLFAFNRDENMLKKTRPLHSFEEDPNIIAGRDLEGKGN